MWIARASGHYAGAVERGSDVLVARDATGEPLGTFTDFGEAQIALQQVVEQEDDFVDRMPVGLIATASISGLCALAMAALAFLVLAQP